nr:uncharacterized protein LOC121114098 [Lepeophtheirus salmonis]
MRDLSFFFTWMIADTHLEIVTVTIYTSWHLSNCCFIDSLITGFIGDWFTSLSGRSIFMGWLLPDHFIIVRVHSNYSLSPLNTTVSSSEYSPDLPCHLLLISEIVIFEIRPEDNGFFYCSAANPAGVVRANFTLQVLSKSNIDPQGKTTKDVSLDVSSINSQTEEEENSETVVEMLKVEYILGFGAAAVVVLTIIIIMILYLVLQCRSRRYKSRLSRALHCDSNSNSNSYIERSTVDFIVPGEMELTSAVRSVSCSSVLSKCNGNKDGPNNNSNNPNISSSNHMTDDEEEDRDKDEDEYGGRKRRTPRAVRHSSLSERSHYMDGPPSYKHPPPPASRSEPLCRCCGEPQWRHPSAGNMGFIPPRFVTPYQEAQHIRDCPRNQMHLSHSRGEWNCGSYPPLSQNYNYFDTNNHAMYNMPNGDVMSQESPTKNMRYRSNSLRNPKKYNNPYNSRPYVYPGMHNSNNNLHYVTMSRGMPGYPRTDLIRYATSQPHLNGNYPQPRSINSMHPNHQNILTPMSLETSITLPRSSPNATISTPRYPYLPRQPPRYNMNNSYANQHKPNLPHRHQSNQIENGDVAQHSNIIYDRNEQKKRDDYLFPDLPPPPDANLPIIKNGSRSSSLDDLSSDSRGHDNSQRPFYTLPNQPGLSMNNSSSSSRRRNSYKNRNSSSMSNSSLNNNNNIAESAVRIDLSDADRAIRRPGSATDLTLANVAASPVRSVLRSNRQGTLECSASIDRRSIIINPSTKGTNKKVMFTGVSDEGEENSNSSAQDIMPVEEDPVWVLRTDKTEECSLKNTDSRYLSTNLGNDVPITGIVIAQPNKYITAGYPPSVMPPKIIPNPLNLLSVNAMSIQQISSHPHHSSSESSSGTVSNLPRPNIGRGSLTLGSSAGSSSSVTSVATPPMMNPILQQQQPLLQHQQQMQGLRPGNPALQRPIQPHFHESPDEGYHEEDGGSETL